MRLRQFIDTHSGPVKIGGNEGSGFFYCGSFEDLRNNQEHYENLLLGYELRRVRKARNKKDEIYEFMLYGWNVWQDYLIKLRRFEELQRQIKYYTGLFSRRVVRAYKATGFDDGAWIVIINSDINGKFWTIDEVKSPTLAFGGSGGYPKNPK